MFFDFFLDLLDSFLHALGSSFILIVSVGIKNVSPLFTIMNLNAHGLNKGR